ncbi:uncharacterized protein LOC118842268 [Trichosurus vulpecula]|uniref:uncharacterized protein LOC118842268 n=1 Tax=Trichosurus vulpecula TaxID=9337 RepID=UPI00186ADCC7|nr:uncharacterized protein LOC118842268 [Trichosurus vulpecula]
MRPQIFPYLSWISGGENMPSLSLPMVSVVPIKTQQWAAFQIVNASHAKKAAASAVPLVAPSVSRSVAAKNTRKIGSVAAAEKTAITRFTNSARDVRKGEQGGDRGFALAPWARSTIKLQLPAAAHQRQAHRNQLYVCGYCLHRTSSERPEPWILETAAALLEALATVLGIANAKNANALPARKEAALPAALLSVLSVPRSVPLAKGMTREAAAIEEAAGFM